LTPNNRIHLTGSSGFARFRRQVMLSVGQTGASVKVGLGLPRHLSARRHFRSAGHVLKTSICPTITGCDHWRGRHLVGWSPRAPANRNTPSRRHVIETCVEDRTDRTDGSPTSHEETLAYYCELWHLAAAPGLRLRVSTRPREPGLRVENWAWEARWAEVSAAVVRDNLDGQPWSVRPWAFVPEAQRALLSARVASLLDETTGPRSMPRPLATSLEAVVPWRSIAPLVLPGEHDVEV